MESSEIQQFSTEERAGRRESSSHEIIEILPEVPVVVPPPPIGTLVYVAVGKGSSSMNALLWALQHAVDQSSVVNLIHVFPKVHSVPTPLGMLPKSDVNPQQLESHMIQVRSKRRELLQKFINLCNDYKVGVETILIESDDVAKAIIDFIPVMQIERLFVGASKNSIRIWRRGVGGKAEQIQKDAPDSCEVKIICEGKEVSAADPVPPSPSTPKKEPKGEEETTNESTESSKCRCLS